MNIEFTDAALEDYRHWKRYESAKINRIRLLLEDIQKTPFTGLGKPEALLYDLKGYWSRRIDREHRLVYKVVNERIIVVACRYHYER